MIEAEFALVDFDDITPIIPRGPWPMSSMVILMDFIPIRYGQKNTFTPRNILMKRKVLRRRFNSNSRILLENARYSSSKKYLMHLRIPSKVKTTLNSKHQPIG